MLPVITKLSYSVSEEIPYNASIMIQLFWHINIWSFFLSSDIYLRINSDHPHIHALIFCRDVKKPFSPPREVHVQVTHSMPPEKIEIFKSMEDWAKNNILVHLKNVENCWQPQDFLPDPSCDGFHDEVKELRERAKEIPDDYFVVLVGDMITEEALPTYQTMLNTLDGGLRDETGASSTPWAVWTRAWTAEENRHGDLLNKYLYLSGRVDMRQIEKTIQYLIGSGMVSLGCFNLLLCFS